MVKIAVASTDGKVVNEHFGRAGRFFILNCDEEAGTYDFLEERQVIPVCRSGNHEDGDLLRNINSLSDCDYILASRIGPRAEREIERMGMQSFEIQGVISELIEKLLRYVKINKLMVR